MEERLLVASVVKWCGGRALNPRTPMGTGLKPVAFDLAWLPPLISNALCSFIFILFHHRILRARKRAITDTTISMIARTIKRVALCL